jgi:DNA recombination-dependent growth factor C
MNAEEKKKINSLEISTNTLITNVAVLTERLDNHVKNNSENVKNIFDKIEEITQLFEVNIKHTNENSQSLRIWVEEHQVKIEEIAQLQSSCPVKSLNKDVGEIKVKQDELFNNTVTARFFEKHPGAMKFYISGIILLGCGTIALSVLTLINK